MKVVLTGASGFVGVNLSSYFREKKTSEITPLDLRKPLPEILFGADAIIHLAGKAHDTKNTSATKQYFDVNTELTKKVFDLFLKSKAAVFIYMSSVKAVADTVDDVLFESVEPDPQTPYGQSKLQAENYMLAQKIPDDRRVFILRPCMIHGPGNKGNLNLLYKFVKKGIPYPLAAFENRRSFLAVNNLNFIIEKLIDDPSIPGGVYNVADDSPLSTNEVINIIAESSGFKSRLWKVNRKLIESVASIGDMLRLPLNTERLKKLTESYVVSNDKIKSALHVDSLPTSSIDGLKATIKSFSNN